MAITLRTKTLLLAAGLLSVCVLRAQDHLITERNISDCDGFFLDSGGNTAGYKANERDTVTICPDATVGTHVQLVFSRVEIIPGDSLCFFDGKNVSAPTLACIEDFRYEGPFVIQATAANPTGCITVVFQSNSSAEGSGWSADINCTQACQTIRADLVTTDPAVMPVDTGWIDVCPSQRIALSAKGAYPQNGLLYQHSDLTSEFKWDFGDGSTAVGPDVTHAYTKSGGYLVQLTIKDNRGCTNTNFINQRVRVSVKPTFAVGDSIPSEICSGDTISLNAIVNQLNKTYAVSTLSNGGSFQAGAVRSDSLALPDGTGTAYETTVKFNNFSPGQVLTNINDIRSVFVNMEHTWLRDLEIDLFCPNGQTVKLHNFGGRNGSEVYLGDPVDFDGTNPTPGKGFQYNWVMGAAKTWLEYADQFRPRTLPAGDYKPYESFDKLIGCPLNGEWKIKVQDLWAIDNGYIFSWGIDFNPALFPELEKFQNSVTDYSWQNNGSIFNFSKTDIKAAPSNAGTASYIFKVTDDFGCNYDTTINVTVLPLTHPNCRSCEKILTPGRDTAVCDVQSIPFNVSVPNLQTQTSVLFETTPFYTFGAATNGPTNPYKPSISVSGVFPLTITNATQQIDSVCLDIETDWLDDLDIYLVSPSGKELELTTGNGGDSDFYRHTCFTPSATNSIRNGTTPFTGKYAPEGNWTVLNGSPIAGNWALKVIDKAGLDGTGVLKSWNITFKSTNAIQYTWSPTTALSCNNCANPVARPTTTTNYIVTAKDNYNCTSNDTITIGVVANAAAPQVSCALTADSSGLQYKWLPLSGFNAYEVKVTKNGVASNWTGPVNDTKYILSGLSNNDTVKVDVRAFTGGANLNCTVDSGAATCAYIICELAIDSVSSTAVDCNNNNTGTASVFVSSGVGTLKYLWNDTLQQIASKAVFLTAGDYKVTVTDANNCIGVANVTVREPDSISITPQITNALCVGEANGKINLDVKGGVGNYRYAWSNGQSSNVATDLATGSYTVSVTDANNCAATKAIFVAEPAAPLSASVTQTFQGCNGARGNSARVVAAGGTGSTYNYAWSNGQTTATAVNLDSINYIVTVTDANGCRTESNLKMSDLARIKANIIIQTPTCSGGKDGAMGVNIITGGVGKTENDYNLRWSTGQTGTAIKNLSGGITYSVTITDSQGCSSDTARLLEQPKEVSFETQLKDALCFGSDNGSATITNAQGQGTRFTYRWDERAKNQNTATATNLIAGTYTVTVTDEKGCTGTSTIRIGQPTKIETSFEVKNNLCFGDNKGTAIVKTKGGIPTYTYAWSSGATTDKLDALVAGTYQITITDKQGCIHTAAAEVKQPTQLLAQLTALDPACNKGRNGSITIAPSGGTSPYQYSLDNRNFNNISKLIALKADSYKVYVKDANGCTFVEKVEIKDPPPFVVDAGNTNYNIKLGDSITLKASAINGIGNVSFVWSAPYTGTLSCTECESVTAKPQDMVIYELYGIDENGCEATDKVMVIVQKIREVAVPTGFTPNADGMNDLLLVHGLPGTKIKSFQVFDRWGELLYESGEFMVNDKNNGWDGTFRNAPMSTGVYIWYLEVEFIDGMTETLKGQTTLIR